MVRIVLISLAALLVPYAGWSSEIPAQQPVSGQSVAVQAEQSVSPQELPVSPPVVPLKILTMDELNAKRYQRLRDISRDLEGQQATMADFDGYLKWMGGALASYGKYVEAGSFAAGFAKYLPVPYAGQAGQATKFISHFALSLSSTSAAVKSYLASSQYLIAGVEALGPSPIGKEHELSQLTFYADQQLSRSMVELQERLSTVSDLSGSALSFLLGLQQYLGSTDEYWQKTKSLVSRKEADKAEKGALAGSIDGLKARAQSFNDKLKQYDAMVGSAMPRIASLVAYDELRQEMEAKTAVVPALVRGI